MLRAGETPRHCHALSAVLGERDAAKAPADRRFLLFSLFLQEINSDGRTNPAGILDFWCPRQPRNSETRDSSFDQFDRRRRSGATLLNNINVKSVNRQSHSAFQRRRLTDDDEE